MVFGDQTLLNTHLIMTTLLRHPVSRHYFKALGKWTLDRDQAYDFGPVLRAARFACKAGFADMELVVSFDHPQSVTQLSFEEICLG
jgi:hypothetical protein